MSYRQIFDEAIGQAPPSGVDIDRVVRRQRRAARVRPALATLAAVALVATGGGLALQLTGDGGPVQVPGDGRAGFPEYFEGARVIAAAEAPTSGSASLTFTADDPDLVLLTRCQTGYAGDVPIVITAELATADGAARTTIDWFCTISSPGTDEPDPAGVDSVVPVDSKLWEVLLAAAAASGGDSTITVTLVNAQAMAGGGDPGIPDGTFAVAVAERVTWEEYEFPPPPAELAPIPDAHALAAELRPDPADPNLPVEATFEWRPVLVSGCGEDVFPLALVSQTPGRMRVLVNGEPVAEHTWWDYRQVGASKPLVPVCRDLDVGDEVTIRVEPEQMTGDWRVRVAAGG